MTGEEKTVMVFYPPSALYQRGEDRCQSNIDSSTSTSIRACNDLGYASSMLKKIGYNTFLKDYQTEKLTYTDLKDDIERIKPDALFMSTTNPTIFDDIKIINEIKKIHPDCTIVLKGALFFDPSDDLLNQLDLTKIDYLIGGESDFIIANLLDAHFNDLERVGTIGGIVYKKNSIWVKTGFDRWEENLDSLCFPDRISMNNLLYVRPDTGEPQATISTSRGCPSSCIYCLTPVISGKKLRVRSPQNIFEELSECYEKHGIRDFFFKSDTFTLDKKWVLCLCRKILDSNLAGKIRWVANSRTKPLDIDTLNAMKSAGCWLVAFGFESGNAETLKLIKKGATLEDSRKAIGMVREVGLKSFGFFMIGFPWEDEKDVLETVDFIFELDADFLELHLATPFHGTGLYELAKKEGLIDEKVLGKDYFNAPTIGTKHLSVDKLVKIRRDTLLKYHMRPSYIIRRMGDTFSNPKILFQYIKFGLRMVKGLLKI